MALQPGPRALGLKNRGVSQMSFPDLWHTQFPRDAQENELGRRVRSPSGQDHLGRFARQAACRALWADQHKDPLHLWPMFLASQSLAQGHEEAFAFCPGCRLHRLGKA